MIVPDSRVTRRDVPGQQGPLVFGQRHHAGRWLAHRGPGGRRFLQSFYRGLLDGGLSPATVNKTHTVLHKALAIGMWLM